MFDLEVRKTKGAEDSIELLFAKLYIELGRQMKWKTRNGLLDLYRNMHERQHQNSLLSPRTTFCNHVISERSTKQSQDLRVFLIDKTGQKILASKQAMNDAADEMRPRTVAFTLVSKEDETVLMDYVPPVKPDPIPTKGKSKQEKKEIKEINKKNKAEYRAKLKLPSYPSLLPQYPESPAPDQGVAFEHYYHVAAGATIDVADNVVDNMEKYNNTEGHKYFYDKDTPVEEDIFIYDGIDGFGNLPLITKQTERMTDDHGVAYDETIQTVKCKPNKLRTRLNSRLDNENDFVDIEDPVEERVHRPHQDEPVFETMFEEENSQSYRNTRPILRGRINENDHCSLVMMTRLIEKERKALENSKMILKHRGYTFKITFHIYTSKVDKKYRDYMFGLASRKYPCFLCKASTEDQRNIEKIFEGFPMNRSLQEMTNIAEYIRVNRDKLSDEEILEIGKGVKHCPISQCETCDLGFDGLHCLLSCGRWLIKIIERLNAGLKTWEIGSELKGYLQTFKSKLVENLRIVLRIPTSFELQGNGCRMLFQDINEDDVLSLLDPAGLDEDDFNDNVEFLKKFLTELRFFLAVILSKDPKEEFSLQEYTTRLKSFTKWLIEDHR